MPSGFNTGILVSALCERSGTPEQLRKSVPVTIKGEICAITSPKGKEIGLYVELWVLCLLQVLFLGLCSPASG